MSENTTSVADAEDNSKCVLEAAAIRTILLFAAGVLLTFIFFWAIGNDPALIALKKSLVAAFFGGALPRLVEGAGFDFWRAKHHMIEKGDVGAYSPPLP